jgi:hypothetical protein
MRMLTALCPHCKAMVQVIDGRLRRHAMPPPKRAICPLSGSVPEGWVA